MRITGGGYKTRYHADGKQVFETCRGDMRRVGEAVQKAYDGPEVIATCWSPEFAARVADLLNTYGAGDAA